MFLHLYWGFIFIAWIEVKKISKNKKKKKSLRTWKDAHLPKVTEKEITAK